MAFLTAHFRLWPETHHNHNIMIFKANYLLWNTYIISVFEYIIS